MNVIIIGGVAGGATAAARLRRLNQTARITILERGSHVSFANCGLPYYVGGVIADEEDLLLADPALFAQRFGIDVLLHHQATSINRATKTVSVQNLATGAFLTLPYDKIVLAPGAYPLRPPLPGLDLEGVFSLRNVPDAKRIKQQILQAKAARSAVVIGAGFIGIEMAENLRHLGLDVTVLERAPQILPPVDADMAKIIQSVLEEHGIIVKTGQEVTGVQSAGSKEEDSCPLAVTLGNGSSISTDIIILAIGVRPETALAQEAGLEVGITGGVKVNETMRTSDADIFAVGDAVEVTEGLTGQPMLLALAGPAQKQARIAADAIMGRTRPFRGVICTSVLEVYGTAVAMTGLSMRRIERLGMLDEVEYVLTHPLHHVGYYPGGTPIHLKLIYRKHDGKVLGAVAIGNNDVARKIDVIAATIHAGGTVYDLEELELCYSPQQGSAKDAVNMLGMTAANNLRGDHPISHLDSLSSNVTILDVRETEEYALGGIPGAINIPLSQLRTRHAELPPGKPVIAYCQVGVRGYNAALYLNSVGHTATNLTGGYTSYLFTK